MEGHFGFDGNYYLLDLARTFPVVFAASSKLERVTDRRTVWRLQTSGQILKKAKFAPMLGFFVKYLSFINSCA